MSKQLWWLLLLLLIAMAALGVAATHRVFAQTYDEPWHVGAGHNYYATGVYRFDLQHPPLARFLFGLPFLDQLIPQTNRATRYGAALLLNNDEYRENLAKARSGNLLFLAIGIVAVALWARHLLSPQVGLIAALLFASLPPVLAHAGLATTDMAVAGLLPLALYTFTLYVEEPTWRRAIVLGIVLGAGLLSKFSFLVFFPVSALLLLIARRRLPALRGLALAGAIASLLVFAAYGFTVGTMSRFDPQSPLIAQKVFGTTSIATTVTLPAPAFFDGIMSVRYRDLTGFMAFLLGTVREHGVWYYFPVALFFKTPIPFLLLAVAGCCLLVRRQPQMVLIAAGILAVSMTSSINIGVRHLLPIYGPLAICAAVAAVEWQRLRLASGALILWLVASTALGHPDYLSWFNGFARHPEQILNDSNLDWGQDVLRLSEAVHELRIRSLTVSIFSTAPLEAIGLPPSQPLDPTQPVHGWLALSENNIATFRHDDPAARAWLEALIRDRPFLRIGESIRLYHVP